MYMNDPIPQQSQFQGQGPFYIKQLEDIFLPPQTFTMDGFPRAARELRPPQYANRPIQPVPNQQSPDFMPFHCDFNRYLWNQMAGYTEPNTYPKMTTGFASVGL
jgi:hypothetical protein